MPAHLAMFRAQEWPAECDHDDAYPLPCSPAQHRVDAYGRARVAWAREHGGPRGVGVLDAFRAWRDATLDS
jgi:hypothetical protein